jgi:pyridoxamine 5'-phosphate oxidase
MIEWVEQLRADFTAEFGTGPKVVTLATAERDGTPRARSVVVRGLRNGGAIVVASDARSEKNKQVRRRDNAEVCAWLPSVRRQYRLACWAAIIGETLAATSPFEPDPHRLREEVWGEMSEAARALFFWPTPGEARVDGPAAFPESVRTGLPPTNFELLYLLAMEADVLDLSGHPHHRHRWRRDTGWAVQEINP